VDLTLEKVLRDLRGRQRQSFKACEWVFPSERTGMPWHAWTAQRRWVVRAGKKAGIESLGWHAFRHTYSTLLNEYGTDAKVQQELLRHADIGYRHDDEHLYDCCAGAFEKGESESRSAFATDRNLTVVPFRSLARESNR